MSLHPSRPTLRLLGSATLVLTASTTVFFVLYSISTISSHSVLSSPCTAAAVFDIATCILLLYFTIFPPQKRIYLLGGVFSTALAVILSTLALAWMSFRPKAMPNTIFGHDRDPLVIAGFSLFVVSLVFQTIFWTLQVFTCSHPFDKIQGLESTPTETAEKLFESHNVTPNNISSTTLEGGGLGDGELGDGGHASFVLCPAPSHTKLHNSTLLYVIQTPPITGLGAEVDPFDTWDTSDVCATQRAACTLAVIECERNMDVAIGLGIFTPVGNVASSSNIGNEVEAAGIEEVVDDVQIRVPVVERQSSPPIPDYDMTPRSASFPANIFREHASMARTPTLVTSPIGDSRGFDGGSGRLVDTKSSRGDLGTGERLVRSQTIV